MLKKIREEKTFKDNIKTDIQEALQNMQGGGATGTKKTEIEDQWIEELIVRKREEVEKYGDGPMMGTEDEKMQDNSNEGSNGLQLTDSLSSKFYSTNCDLKEDA